ncbi:SUF system NifU family Fe-S cluster assembly protein [Candidatus Woesearchaeota archaeon]|nr:SUF system NifU family Fe-S cluster assembly protein [Candidatus Woesearchaeota archaeon]
MNAEAMYAETIMDHYRHPHHYGALPVANAHAHDVNTSCGDEIGIQMEIKDGRIADIRFNGKGCAISQAATSLLTDFVIGKPLDEAARLQKDDVLELLGIELSPMRLKCALLGFKVFKLAAYGYLGSGEYND